nr:hypothetical protein Iba_scaffold15697CG0010 [Ipomoea batatas]
MLKSFWETGTEEKQKSCMSIQQKLRSLTAVLGEPSSLAMVLARRNRRSFHPTDFLLELLSFFFKSFPLTLVALSAVVFTKFSSERAPCSSMLMASFCTPSVCCNANTISSFVSTSAISGRSCGCLSRHFSAISANTFKQV